MTQTQVARRLVAGHGRTFAEEAGIVLADEPEPLWQLLVLTQLLSTRIASRVAVRAAREIYAAGWTAPERLRASTWRGRVDALGRGGYRRYDVSTATRLDENAALLIERWGGDLRRLRAEAGDDPREIARLLQELAGIGPTAAAIFLREVQVVWPQVGPQVDALVRLGATAAGLPTTAPELAALVPAQDLGRLCAALVRVARRPALLDS
ncbi:endonuclease [Arsenicicoccus dermatophilus]|uniref:endonuclease n=1 Tax=Arsenicicoccus dermatophilus TaxID=1076331 RepID=UPI001F4C982C|nr:endonuclease [Arsenicicoccus dermatophilus]MCH8613023.1 endonuclease [Arsenicicoccus dermatophilus]